MTGWQDISTAPQTEGKVLLRWRNGTVRVGECVFGSRFWECEGGRFASGQDALGEAPTHWMPLPEPPA